MNKKDKNQKKKAFGHIIHILFVFALGSLIAYLIVLLINASGFESLLPVNYFIYPIVLIIVFYLYHRMRIKRIKKERIEIRNKTKIEINNLPKKYDFFCPHCLFQTNDLAKVCPNCGKGELFPTSDSLKG
ncbi:MAG: hypothetical protein JSW00_16065 [Thermoplasmata archaeon]|nr:MAG: hypothetical protein JSW00_16065 [Thermoplasmata archaeon]